MPRKSSPGWWSRSEPNKSRSSSVGGYQKKPSKTIEIKCRGEVWTTAFLADGEHIVSGGDNGEIRRWRVDDGTEVGVPMNAGGIVRQLAVSPDGRWLVSGTQNGHVTVWDTRRSEKATEFRHARAVWALDVAPTKIATGSCDRTIRCWSLWDGKQLLEPLHHDDSIVAVKFSPNRRLIATATREDLEIYDSQSGRHIVTFSIQLGSHLNQSLAWASDSKRLFALSSDGIVHCVDVSTRETLSKWCIHREKDPKCIALAGDGTFVAVSTSSSITFWDTMAHHQIGSVVTHPANIQSMAISPNYDLVIGGGRVITLQSLYDILPSHYTDYKHRGREACMTVEQAVLEEAIWSLGAQDEHCYTDASYLGNTVEDLHRTLAVSDCAAEQKERSLTKAITSLQGDLRTRRPSSGTESQRKIDEETTRLIQTLQIHEWKYRCEALYADGHTLDAVASLLETVNAVDKNLRTSELAQWELEFRRRCIKNLEQLGDSAMDVRDYKSADEYFSAILSLDRTVEKDILIKLSRARSRRESKQIGAKDGAAVLPSRRAKDQLNRRTNFVSPVITTHSHPPTPNEHVQAPSPMYVDARPTIRNIINETIRHVPRVLIDTSTGRLCGKEQLAEAFAALPIYHNLVLSMVTELDYARIYNEVKEFFRYVMLSHTWEDGEPLLQAVENISVYDLEASPTNIKLQKFCSLVHSLGFRWAWSDTCCVDKKDNVVLQESLVAMFTWYRGSSLTVIYLRGVLSRSKLPGLLQSSKWNTRGWTYQEYVAAETVQFYTDDWKPYLGLTLHNHKESPDVVLEMQQATGVSPQGMAVLQPGLDRVREKLYLASTRRTTLIEDMAYSLLGIFNVAIPVIYGEGNRAVGRLLDHILTGSGDVTILAWTGRAGGYNSCLPVNLTPYSELVPPHVPGPIEQLEMDRIVTTLRSTLQDPLLAITLHNQLKALPPPSFAASRLRLPGIVCPITDLDHISGPDPGTKLHVYRATTPLVGDVEIKTTDELTGMNGLCLVHPWIHPLLDQEFLQGADALDKATQALRFVARLRQPFGALALAPVSRIGYKRVAADGLLVVQIREEASLEDVLQSVRTVEIQ